MNPNDVDQQAPWLSEESSEMQPRVLSAATILATVLMLVFGLSGFMGIFGVAISLTRTTDQFAVLQKSLSDTDKQDGMPSDPTDSDPKDDARPQVAEAIEIPTSIMNPLTAPASPWQIGLGILDFALSIPMFLWSIFVLQHKRSAAEKLAWLALLMAILMIPRAIIGYVSLPSMSDAVKTMVETQNQKTNSNVHPEDLDAILQVFYVGALGCGGFFMLLTLIAYLFCFIQLRKPTTLARLSA